MKLGTVLLDTAPSIALSAFAHRALAAMDVEVYVRRAPPVVSSDQLGWNSTELASVLARALARAAGYAQVEAFCAAWQARGIGLPSLETVRSSANAKRETWRQMRAQRRAP